MASVRIVSGQQDERVTALTGKRPHTELEDTQLPQSRLQHATPSAASHPKHCVTGGGEVCIWWLPSADCPPLTFEATVGVPNMVQKLQARHLQYLQCELACAALQNAEHCLTLESRLMLE
mmetsp:Transcript_8750/g.14690  ORF Transcript_8750/g.14690 Transcript_8750/m.14690 type:complete len:120 (-) Transcript_8750:48-407(-)